VDQVQLRKAAADLERLLLKYAAIDQEAALLHKCLSELVGSALRGEITAARGLGRVPGSSIQLGSHTGAALLASTLLLNTHAGTPRCRSIAGEGSNRLGLRTQQQIE
jgi:hypothetical protein